ncbi:ribosylnicotinamide kinase [Balamuthia mandrillaris]
MRREGTGTKSKSLWVVGIAGASSSGKTTLSKSLAKAFFHEEEEAKAQQQQQQEKFRREGWTTTWLSLDSFYKDYQDIPQQRTTSGRLVYNFDSPRSIDWPRFISAVRARSESLGLLSSHPKFLFVEGLLLYHSKETRDLFDIKLFLRIRPETSFQRRLQRREEAWQEVPDEEETFGEYFEEVLWPEYEANNRHVLMREDEEEKEEEKEEEYVRTFDADDVSEREIFEQVKNYLSTFQSSDE